MKPRRSDDAQAAWKRELRETPDCVPIERFEALTAQEQAHIEHCTRCEAEFALWQELSADAFAPQEGAAVQWVAAEVARRRSAPVLRQSRVWTAWLETFRVPRLAVAAIAVLVLLSGVYLTRDREPAIGTPPRGDAAFRSAGVEVIAPTGDVANAPTALQWKPVTGASTYRVELLEVDRTVLWEGRTGDTSLQLPAAVVRLFAPGKTIFWTVTAHGADSTVIAASPTQRVRVSIGSLPPAGRR